MLLKNLFVAALLFFGWLGVDAIGSLAGHPLEGVLYPLESARLRGNLSMAHNWTDKASFVAPFLFVVFALLWWFLIRRQGLVAGARIASLITAFLMVSFWVVPAVSADMYDLELNRYWLVSMIYCNLSFVVFGFLGRGSVDDMSF